MTERHNIKCNSELQNRKRFFRLIMVLVILFTARLMSTLLLLRSSRFNCCAFFRWLLTGLPSENSELNPLFNRLVKCSVISCPLYILPNPKIEITIMSPNTVTKVLMKVIILWPNPEVRTSILKPNVLVLSDIAAALQSNLPTSTSLSFLFLLYWIPFRPPITSFRSPVSLNIGIYGAWYFS